MARKSHQSVQRIFARVLRIGLYLVRGYPRIREDFSSRWSGGISAIDSFGAIFQTSIEDDLPGIIESAIGQDGAFDNPGSE